MINRFIHSMCVASPSRSAKIRPLNRRGGAGGADTQLCCAIHSLGLELPVRSGNSDGKASGRGQSWSMGEVVCADTGSSGGQNDVVGPLLSLEQQ